MAALGDIAPARSDRLLRLTGAGLSAAAIGVFVLFVQAVREVLADPGISLQDGYWIGRLPWTTVGVGLVVIGATLGLGAGTVLSWVTGGWIRRGASGLALGVGLAWWLLAMLPPPRGAFCADCPAPGPDPLTMAYSLPEGVILFLVLPSIVAAVAGRRGAAAQRHRPASDRQVAN